MARQVRIDDDIADWLAGQGGSVSAAANRTLAWARDVIEQQEEYEEEPEPVSVTVPPAPPQSGHNGQQPRAGKTSTSTAAARRRPSFSPIIRRP